VRKRRNGDHNNDNSRCREASIMTPALRTAHATARSLGRQPRMRGSARGGRAKRKIWHGLDQTSLLLLGSTSNLASHREELCFILSVRHCRFSCGLRRESTTAYASVDHMDSRARYCRLDYRRSSDAFVLPAKRWGPISPRWVNCFHTRRNLGPFSLAQVQIARTTRVKL